MDNLGSLLGRRIDKYRLYKLEFCGVMKRVDERIAERRSSGVCTYCKSNE